MNNLIILINYQARLGRKVYNVKYSAQQGPFRSAYPIYLYFFSKDRKIHGSVVVIDWSKMEEEEEKKGIFDIEDENME